jgi:hypothetical protein
VEEDDTVGDKSKWMSMAQLWTSDIEWEEDAKLEVIFGVLALLVVVDS